MKRLLSLLAILFSVKSLATPAFVNITDADFNSISKEMAANFTHSSMMGASKLGQVFGFQVGLVAAQTGSPNTNSIAQRTAGAEIPSLYNAGVFGVIGIPYGISLEAMMTPGFSASGTSLKSNSFALKVNMNEWIPVLPINLALRGVYSSAQFSFDQVISGINSKVENKTSVTGLQVLLSPMLPLVEPYVGLGLLNASNELGVSGSLGTVFDPGFSLSQTEKRSLSSTQFIAGVEASLLLLKLGVEYSQSFGASRYGIKLALGF